MTPYYRNITLRQFQGRSAGNAFKVKGIPESPASELLLDRCDIHSEGLFYLADVAGVRIRDSQFQSDTPELFLLEANGVNFERVAMETPKSHLIVQLSGPGTKNVTFEQCEPTLIMSQSITSDGATAEVIQESR